MLHKQYGFRVDPHLPAWLNARNITLSTPATFLFNQPKNNSIFVFTKSTLPPGTHSLLGLGLKFCIKAKHPTNNLDKTINRFTEDVRTKYWVLQQNFNEEEDFNPKIYIKNPDWVPPLTNDEIETSIQNFTEQLQSEQQKYQQLRSRPNLTPLQSSAPLSLSLRTKTWAYRSGTVKSSSSKSSMNT